MVLFDQFLDEYKKAEIELTQRAEQAEKQRKTEAEKEKRFRELEEKRIKQAISGGAPAAAGAAGAGASEGGAPAADLSKVVDATLTTLSSGNASDLAAAVRAKRAMAGEKIAAHRANQQTLKPGSQGGDKPIQFQMPVGLGPSQLGARKFPMPGAKPIAP